jgi:hypothetical protein
MDTQRLLYTTDDLRYLLSYINKFDAEIIAHNRSPRKLYVAVIVELPLSIHKPPKPPTSKARVLPPTVFGHSDSIGSSIEYSFVTDSGNPTLTLALFLVQRPPHEVRVAGLALQCRSNVEVLKIASVRSTVAPMCGSAAEAESPHLGHVDASERQDGCVRDR